MNRQHKEPRLQLVFRGECVEGHDPQAVRQALVQALELDARRADKLFSGQPVVLRRGLDEALAHRHIARFALLGAVLRAEPSVPSRRAVARAGPAGFRLARWRRVSQWAGIGVLCLVGGPLLGIWLGPGLSTLLPEAAQPRTVAAPQASAASSVARDPAPAAPAGAAPPALTDADIPADMRAEALRDYRLRYLAEPNHKAFAISSTGAHAWHAGAESEDAARTAVLERCTAALQAGDDGCRIVDADGSWQE